MKRMISGLILLAAVQVVAQTTAAPPASTTIPNPLKPASDQVLASPADTDAGSMPCASIKEARNLVGKAGCVSGKVVKVTESRGGNIYVNFCSDYRKCAFSAVSLRRASAALGDLRELEGKIVELRGNITAYQGAPEMQLKRREQITVTGEFKNKPQRPYEAVDFRMGGQGRTHHSGFKPRQQHER